MKLYRLLERMEYSVLSGNVDITVSTIAKDSSEVITDSVFVCIQESYADGHDSVNEAIANGATAVIVERQVYVPEQITVILVGNTKAALSYMAAAYYGYPTERVKTVGITGSKGKTTTCRMIESLLSAGGYDVGYIEAVKDPLLFQKQCSKLVEEKKDVVIVEVSSMCCKHYRIAGMTFDIGVLINLMRTHIGTDEHSSYEEYIDCKAQLFRQCRLGIVNADCNKLQEILKNHSCRIETFGRKQGTRLYAQYPVLIQKTGCLGNQFYVGGVMCSSFELWMPGLFNIYNALAAIMVARQFEIEEEVIKKALATVQIAGHYESLSESADANVLYDEAEDARAVKEVLDTVRAYVPHSKLICVYCPEKYTDKIRHYAIGKILAQNADEIVMVEEDSLQEVIDDISVGISEYNGCLKLVATSRDACELCINEAGPKDMVVIAGLGKEVYHEATKVMMK